MARRLVLFALAAIALIITGFAIESKIGSTSYTINGISYSVPHKYEFMRQFRVPWLEGIKGLEPEPDESVWLLIPADEISKELPGYSRRFHGYATEEPADVVVNVLGGREARQFPDDVACMDGQIKSLEQEGARREADPTGWERIISLDGVKGTPAEGHLNFYLTPTSKRPMPQNWLPPSCLASPDINRRETYYCNFTINVNGRTFAFSLRRENLQLADQIPNYVAQRLDRWK